MYSGVIAALISCSLAGAEVGDTAVIEGVVIRFDRKTVTLSNRGAIQKIPRSLVPEKTSLKPGLFVTIEVPITKEKQTQKH